MYHTFIEVTGQQNNESSSLQSYRMQSLKQYHVFFHTPSANNWCLEVYKSFHDKRFLRVNQNYFKKVWKGYFKPLSIVFCFFKSSSILSALWLSYHLHVNIREERIVISLPLKYNSQTRVLLLKLHKKQFLEHTSK